MWFDVFMRTDIQKVCVFVRYWMSCSKCVNHYRLDGQHDWVWGGGTCMTTWWVWNIHFDVRKIFVWALKVLRKMGMELVWICWSSCTTIACFVLYMKWWCLSECKHKFKSKFKLSLFLNQYLVLQMGGFKSIICKKKYLKVNPQLWSTHATWNGSPPNILMGVATHYAKKHVDGRYLLVYAVWWCPLPCGPK